MRYRAILLHLLAMTFLKVKGMAADRLDILFVKP